MQTRKEIANSIYQRLLLKKEDLKTQFKASNDSIGYFFLDDLLPKDFALNVFNKFPDVSSVKQRKNLREFKYVAYKMNAYNPLLKEVLYAFQEDKVVDLIAEVCGFTNVFPDKYLYAGGLSLMGKDNFLNPHIDNSHDKDRNRWRVLNLLYYVSPDWELENGGNLELWQHGLEAEPTVIESKFNRLVVMVTHQNSWHSVNKIEVDKLRCCVSNYYFSTKPSLATDKFHVTTFRGRPTEKLKDFVLKADASLRESVRKVFKKGIRENPHQYKDE